MSPRSLIPFVAVPLALAACKTKEEPPPGTEGQGEDITVELKVEPGPLAGILIATATTSAESTVELRFGLDDTTQLHPQSSDGSTEHRFVVLGLKADQDYQLEATARAGGRSGHSEIVTAHVSPVEEEVPSFSVTTSDDALTCHPDGYVLLTWIKAGHSGVTIVDHDGDIVWSLPLIHEDVQASRARVGTDGASIVYTVADALRQDLVGEVIVQPIDGSPPTATSAPTAHHDFVQLPDGRLAWLGYAFGDYTCDDGSVLEDVAVDTIEEAEIGGASTEVYNMFDDYPHPLDCDAGNAFFLPDWYDLTHSNSLMYRASDDAYFHMIRWHDALVKVDRSTGTYQWQLGGTDNDFTPAAGQDPAALFTHGHMSDIWDGGLLIFDNNDPGPSWVRRYTLDEQAMTWELTWSWDTESFELLLGDARRIPSCDNLLVTQSTAGVVRELVTDTEGSTAWLLQAEENTIITRVEFIPDIYDLTSAMLPE